MRLMGASSENLSKYCAFYEDHPGGGPCPLLDRKGDLGNSPFRSADEAPGIYAPRKSNG